MFGLFYITRQNHKKEADFWFKTAASLGEACGELQTRLDAIAAQETPGANATVKRMAAIARGERPA